MSDNSAAAVGWLLVFAVISLPFWAWIWSAWLP